MLSFATVAKELSISILASIASLANYITADQLDGLNTVLKVWKVCRTLTPANPSEAIGPLQGRSGPCGSAPMQRPTVQGA